MVARFCALTFVALAGMLSVPPAAADDFVCINDFCVVECEGGELCLVEKYAGPVASAVEPVIECVASPTCLAPAHGESCSEYDLLYARVVNQQACLKE